MIPLRLARELTYQLDKAGEDERLARSLANPVLFLLLFETESRTDVLRLWQRLALLNNDPVEYYSISLKTLRYKTNPKFTDFLIHLGKFFEIRGTWDFSSAIFSELLHKAELSQSPELIMEARRGLGTIDHLRGKLDGAMEHLEEAYRLAGQLENKRTKQAILGGIGYIYTQQSNYDKATLCYQEQILLSDELGFPQGKASALGSLGLLLNYQGRFDEALHLMKQALDICNAIEDRRSLAVAEGSIGIVYYNQGLYDKAFESYAKQLSIAQELGDMRIASYALGNIGAIRTMQGKYREAKRYFQHDLEISTGLGEESRSLIARTNIASLDMELREYGRAYPPLKETLSMDRKRNDLWGVTYDLCNLARILFEVSEMNEYPDEMEVFLPTYNDANWRGKLLIVARTYLEECVQLSDQLSKPDTLSHAKRYIAFIEAAEGSIPLAVERLQTLKQTTTDPDEIAHIYFSHWKITKKEEYREEALHRFNELLHTKPNFDLVRSIAELRGERVPMSADDLDEKMDIQK